MDLHCYIAVLGGFIWGETSREDCSFLPGMNLLEPPVRRGCLPLTLPPKPVIFHREVSIGALWLFPQNDNSVLPVMSILDICNIMRTSVIKTSNIFWFRGVNTRNWVIDRQPDSPQHKIEWPSVKVSTELIIRDQNLVCETVKTREMRKRVSVLELRGSRQ